jgi:hypothetical protein
MKDINPLFDECPHQVVRFLLMHQQYSTSTTEVVERATKKKMSRMVVMVTGITTDVEQNETHQRKGRK